MASADKTMLSRNFEFLRADWPELAELAAFAEQYAHVDATGAAVKVRTFAEQMVLGLYARLGIPKPEDDSFLNLLRDTDFCAAIPPQIVSRLHSLRKIGNRAAHGSECTTKDALAGIEFAFQLGCWLAVAHGNVPAACLPDYSPPTCDFTIATATERQRFVDKLAKQDTQLEALLSELAKARAETAAAQKTAAQLEQELQRGIRVVDELQFDEASTRRFLIDTALADAGWKLAASTPGTGLVVMEESVEYQPTQTGLGYADYVLRADNHAPLGVVEAKRTAESKDKGRTQAKLYADGIEKKEGQRPVIFYTNGHETAIWNDADNEPPRPVFGFPSTDDLAYMVQKRGRIDTLATTAHNPQIVNRLYQIEAVRRIAECFASRRRRALVVQATGTGKTRVAVALCELLIRAGIVRRVLFLCDRVELRKQAHGVFKEFLPGEPRTFVTAQTNRDKDQRIYLATYPAMMKCFERFPVSFFDLVIADESHRSIYNRYRHLLTYFDAFKVGLTATPVNMIQHNTFELFGCPDQDPTAHYSLNDAVANNYLVPFRVIEHRTEFHRNGLKYSDLTDEQRAILEDQDEDAPTFDFDPNELDRVIFNKDTNRHVLRNLMENGIREATGSHPAKSIVFARNHRHAELLSGLFDEMYPQYGGGFCRVIDHYDPRAETLIDEFKDPTKPLTIAISVDMLDTGIDVPEVVNLVFAKPVRSKVKFWQMIGRGTRLCVNLFGPGKHKKEFLIFDHWGNFRYFDERFRPYESARPTSLLQRLFEARLILAETALQAADTSAFDIAISGLAGDIRALPETSIPIREQWRQVKLAGNTETLRRFEAPTVSALRGEIAPLMQWRPLAAHAAAYEFDWLIARLQTERIAGSATYDDLRDELLDAVSSLRMNLNPVQEKAATIQQIRKPEYWQNATVSDLETLRTDMRGIMHYRLATTSPSVDPKQVDVPEEAGRVETGQYVPRDFSPIEMAAFRNRVDSVLRGLLATNPTLAKIRKGEAVTTADLDTLKKLVLVQDPMVNLDLLYEFYPETVGHLDLAIRRIVGLDDSAVEPVFADFVREHKLTARQVRFLDLLKGQIRQFGAIRLEQLYEAPFTTLHSDGVDGVFTDDNQVNALFGVLERFQNPTSDYGKQRPNA